MFEQNGSRGGLLSFSKWYGPSGSPSSIVLVSMSQFVRTINLSVQYAIYFFYHFFSARLPLIDIQIRLIRMQAASISLHRRSAFTLCTMHTLHTLCIIQVFVKCIIEHIEAFIVHIYVHARASSALSLLNEANIMWHINEF